MAKKFYTVNEAAKYLGISRAAVRLAIKKDRPDIPVGLTPGHRQAVFKNSCEGGCYMFSHSTNAASLFSVRIAALILSLSLAGVAAAQVNNTSLGTAALQNNTTGSFNTASGFISLFSNTTGVSTRPPEPMRCF